MPFVLTLLALTACGGSTSPVPPASAAKPAARSAEASTVVGTWKGGQLTLAEVEAKVQGRIDAMEQEYQLQRYELLNQALNSAIDDALLEAEAAARGHADARALLAEEIEAQVTLPTDVEIAAFYEQVKGQLRGAPLEEVQPMIATELLQRQMGQRYQTYIAELRAKVGVEAAIPYPDIKRVQLALGAEDPVLGPRDAPVSIVQFAEYQCYYCAKVSPTLRALVDDYKGKVNVVFKDFPLDNHPRAMPAAIAARCAGEQGKYWEMNDRLLANQQRLSDADFRAHAADLGLDATAFQTCVSGDVMAERARASFAEGEKLGVQATPTFYVNGLLVSGAQPYDRFKAIIDQELAKGR